MTHQIDNAALMDEYLAGASMNELAAKYGCSYTTIQRRIREYEWPLPAVQSSAGADALSWQSRGLCNDYDPDSWYRESSTGQAKYVCRACVVQTTCLQYALDNDERAGVWGGLSERERARLKKGRAA